MSEPREIVATYLVETDKPKEALNAICRGQTVGNPNILTHYETQDFLNKWCANGKFNGFTSPFAMKVRFPDKNFGAEGISYLLSVLMGGQCDIDIIKGCRLIDINLGSFTRHFSKPRYGLNGIRSRLGVLHRPLLCGIIKPKIGLTPKQLTEVVKQMIDGGCDVIKEDEILSNQFWCPMDKRLDLLAPLLQESSSLYLTCITADGSEAWKRARRVASYGDHFGVHCNLWAGLGTLRDIRDHAEVPLFFQKSGDKVWTTGNYSIDYTVICELLNLIGCDFAHVGMYGGYMAEPVEELRKRILALKNTIPSFSCGMTPSIAEQTIARFDSNIMLTVGGWIHGQQEGVESAVKKMRQAIETCSVQNREVQEGLDNRQLQTSVVHNNPI